jgi:ubiquinone/menaquinone biosynthesis C-methylase UbiE
MSDWAGKLFVEHADLFLKLLNEKWSRTEDVVSGIVRVLSSLGITSGNLLDLCCGNGRISIHMAKKGFKAVGVDFSRAFLDDAKKKAVEHGVSNRVTFLEGDVRNLREVVGHVSQSFDVIVSAWTSIGYSSVDDDVNVFRQARELSGENAVLIIADTMHSDFIAVKFTPTGYQEVDDIVLLENRKYDPTTSQLKATWAFYNKRGEDLEFIDRVEIENHVYSQSELSSVLRKAGWEPVAFYGSFLTLQVMGPFGSLNAVARAK